MSKVSKSTSSTYQFKYDSIVRFIIKIVNLEIAQFKACYSELVAYTGSWWRSNVIWEEIINQCVWLVTTQHWEAFGKLLICCNSGKENQKRLSINMWAYCQHLFMVSTGFNRVLTPWKCIYFYNMIAIFIAGGQCGFKRNRLTIEPVFNIRKHFKTSRI